jgi:hypothetical protein
MVMRVLRKLGGVTIAIFAYRLGDCTIIILMTYLSSPFVEIAKLWQDIAKNVFAESQDWKNRLLAELMR